MSATFGTSSLNIFSYPSSLDNNENATKFMLSHLTFINTCIHSLVNIVNSSEVKYYKTKL